MTHNLKLYDFLLKLLSYDNIQNMYYGLFFNKQISQMLIRNI